MIELTHTLSPPPTAAVPEPVHGMLGGQEYLSVRHGLLTAGCDRPPFSNQVKTALPVDDGQARCHYVSYKLIAKCITSILNNALSAPPSINTLYCLYHSVFCYSVGMDKAKDNAFSSIAILASIFPPAVDKFLPEATNLLVNLNSSVSNLRVGDQEWNASIREQYDPAHWWYAVSARQYRDRTGTVKPLPDGMPDLKQGEFYLQASDETRLSPLKPLANLLPTVGFYSAIDESGIPFVYSSNNQFSLPEATEEYRGPVNFIPDSCFAI